ncbi:MAG: hypothetical protein CVV03_09525 [Firmicutes bacterium HGW-Firmicutes-8]|nr:MAG: hypothetical protein CVV03_09525 [Firmicutes bacterium HGW-Firmicutes-8]
MVRTSFGIGRLRAAMIEGDCETGTVACGQIAGLIKEIKPAKAIVDEIVEGAKTVIQNLR